MLAKTFFFASSTSDPGTCMCKKYFKAPVLQMQVFFNSVTLKLKR